MSPEVGWREREVCRQPHGNISECLFVYIYMLLNSNIVRNMKHTIIFLKKTKQHPTHCICSEIRVQCHIPSVAASQQVAQQWEP